MNQEEEFENMLRRAVDGDPDAIAYIIESYMPLWRKYSVIDGQFDEDCQQYIIMRALPQIGRFKKYIDQYDEKNGK